MRMSRYFVKSILDVIDVDYKFLKIEMYEKINNIV